MKFNETDEKNWICSHFDKMLLAGSELDQDEYIFKHPLLLSIGVIPIITAAKGNDLKVTRAITHLDEIRKHYWVNFHEYPIGKGPLEKILDSMRNGSIQPNEAIEQARKIECSGLLSPLYIKAIMQNWVEELNNDITFTMQAAEIAVEAVIAMPLQSLSLHVMMQSTEGFIRLAHGSLLRRPDGKVYARAINLGQWSAKVAENSGNLPLKGEFLHNIGTLSLDAYAANFGPSPEFLENINLWLGRAVNPMPQTSEGLANARVFLSNAVALRDAGSERGKTIKALLETIIYEAFTLGKNPDINYLSSLSEEALAHLDPQLDGSHITRINDLMGIYI